MQRGFLYDIGMCDTEAFVKFNLAPPSLRRAIGLLGFLHKRVLGICHPAVVKAFPFVSDSSNRYHTKTLVSHFGEVRHFPALYDNSIWQYVLIYNRLPQVFVDAQSVSTFQSKLTQLVKMRAQCDDLHWRSAFQSCEDTIAFFYAN